MKLSRIEVVALYTGFCCLMACFILLTGWDPRWADHLVHVRNILTWNSATSIQNVFIAAVYYPYQILGDAFIIALNTSLLLIALSLLASVTGRGQLRRLLIAILPLAVLLVATASREIWLFVGAAALVAALGRDKSSVMRITLLFIFVLTSLARPIPSAVFAASLILAHKVLSQHQSDKRRVLGLMGALAGLQVTCITLILQSSSYKTENLSRSAAALSATNSSFVGQLMSFDGTNSDISALAAYNAGKYLIWGPYHLVAVVLGSAPILISTVALAVLMLGATVELLRNIIGSWMLRVNALLFGSMVLFLAYSSWMHDSRYLIPYVILLYVRQGFFGPHQYSNVPSESSAPAP